MRVLRERATMSLEGLSSVVRISRSHLSRIETAEVMPPPSLPKALDSTFRTDGIFAELYLLACREVHPDQFRRRMELEAKAEVIEEYAAQIVPGLLQTEAYARAQFQVSNPKATDEEIAELLTARMSRQELLRGDSPPDLSLILDEAVLRRGFGSPGTMREQLRRLEELTLTPRTVVQVLPFEHGGRALVGGALTLMTFSDRSHVAYEEACTTGTLLEDAPSVAKHQRAYDLMRACALSPDRSASFIRSVMEALLP